MAEIKTLPMILRTCARIDHLSVLFLLDLVTEKQLSVVITTKHAICDKKWPIYCYEQYYVWKHWDKNFEGPQNMCALKITDP